MQLPPLEVDELWVGWQMRQIPRGWLTDSQQLAHQMLGETYNSLLSYRDAIGALRASIPFDPASGPQPSPNQQQLLYNATRDFSNAFYSSMEAMMGFFTRVPMQGYQPPRRSVAKFNIWLSSLEGTLAPLCVPVLERERKYRTAITHSAELPPFDWMTVTTDELPVIHIRLFGIGKIPSVAVENTTVFPGDWEIESQSEVAVCEAYGYAFLLLAGLASAALADLKEPDR